MTESNAATNHPEVVVESRESSVDAPIEQPVDGSQLQPDQWPSPELTEALVALDRPGQRPYGWADAVDALGGGLLRTDGRVARSEYWMGSAILAAIWVPITLALVALTRSDSLVMIGGAVLGLLVWLPFVAFVEALRAVRRLHDCGRTGWFVLLALVPFGLIGLIWLLTQPAEPGHNRFGPMSQPGWDGSLALAS